MADDPWEELFADVAVEEAAMVGACVFAAELLMDSVVRLSGAVAGVVAIAVAVRVCASDDVIVAESQIRASGTGLQN